MFEYTPPKNLLEERIILVTGAGSGIGRTASLTLAHHGATVILLGRTASKLESVYDEIEQLGGPKAVVCTQDLLDLTETQCSALVQQLSDSFGKLDGLLHNAAIIGELTSLAQTRTEHWNDVMQVNLTAPMLLTRSVLPLLRTPDTASVIFTSSSVGHRGRAYWGAYSASKFATESLVQVLADEEDGISNVRFNSLNPGPTRTALRSRAFPGEDPMTCTPPEAIMPLYLYLLGEESRAISGRAFHAQQDTHHKNTGQIHS